MSYSVNEYGYYGKFGGAYIPEMLYPNVEELRTRYLEITGETSFQRELAELLKDYVGRPTPLYYAKRLSEQYQAKIFLKREDLCHTGAHKINNTCGQILLAQRLGKTRIIAETGAGQHGVATATVCALKGMECIVYMGEKDIERQAPNVARMKMLGATVMPHVIYLHSHLVQTRRTSDEKDCIHHLKMAKVDVFFAMNMAFIVNAAMVIVSAAVFNGNGLSVDSIEAAYMTLQPLMGNMAAGVFGLALLASGLSSATVGTMAGEVILNGFVGFDIPISIRRLITMLPGIAILMAGINPMSALITSQVVLSFALPAAVIPLMLISNNAALMGRFKNSGPTNIMGWLIVSMILTMNAVLLYLIFTGQA